MRTNRESRSEEHSRNAERKQGDVTWLINIKAQRTVGEHFFVSPQLEGLSLPRGIPASLLYLGMQQQPVWLPQDVGQVAWQPPPAGPGLASAAGPNPQAAAPGRGSTTVCTAPAAPV